MHANWELWPCGIHSYPVPPQHLPPTHTHDTCAEIFTQRLPFRAWYMSEELKMVEVQLLGLFRLRKVPFCVVCPDCAGALSLCLSQDRDRFQTETLQIPRVVQAGISLLLIQKAWCLGGCSQGSNLRLPKEKGAQRRKPLLIISSGIQNGHSRGCFWEPDSSRNKASIQLLP